MPAEPRLFGTEGSPGTLSGRAGMMRQGRVAVLDYLGRIGSHYESVWGASAADSIRLEVGPIGDLPRGFSVLEFPPGARRAWTYATCGMSQAGDERRLELHLLSPSRDVAHVELLTSIAHYHRTGAPLGLGHTVNFGRPWMGDSKCTHGLISLPYLDGPQLGVLELPIGRVEFSWLVPVTPREVEFLARNGLEAFEQKFDDGGFNDYEGFRVLLTPDRMEHGAMLRLRFAPVAYRSSDESYRLRTWQGKSSLHGGTFSIVENSPFTAELRREASGILDDRQLVHHAIYTTTDCVDVVSSEPPVADWLGSASFE